MSAVSLRASLVRASEAPDTSQVLQRWRRQVAGRSELSERRGVRPFAFLGYRMRDAPLERLVPLDGRAMFAPHRIAGIDAGQLPATPADAIR